jgi:hypothetical protein
MNVVAFPAPDEREIMEEIRAWSAHALERNSPYFNGLPPCPYAKAAWRENQVTIFVWPARRPNTDHCFIYV